MMRNTLAVVLAIGVGVGCGTDEDPDANDGSGGLTGASMTVSSTDASSEPEPGSTGSITTGSSGVPGSSGETSGGSSAGATTTGLDSASTSEGLEGSSTSVYEPPMTCQAVDFLFVIDNSLSMGPEQESLVGAFPGFMETITTQLEAGSDYHVMVLDTDAWGRCNTANVPAWDAQSPTNANCNDYIEMTEFEECDRVRGAGVVHPAGVESSNMECTPASGGRYIDSTEPDLAGMFSCMATVGLAGHPSERPMNAIEAALEPGGDAEVCNEGFLREDALLVVTFISDDTGTADAGDPADWYDAVVAAKNGDPAGVVVLGLGPADPGCGQNGGQHWLEFVELWGDNGLHGPVCGTAEEYVSFFQSSVAIIDQACETFVPG